MNSDSLSETPSWGQMLSRGTAGTGTLALCCVRVLMGGWVCIFLILQFTNILEARSKNHCPMLCISHNIMWQWHAKHATCYTSSAIVTCCRGHKQSNYPLGQPTGLVKTAHLAIWESNKNTAVAQTSPYSDNLENGGLADSRCHAYPIPVIIY